MTDIFVHLRPYFVEGLHQRRQMKWMKTTNLVLSTVGSAEAILVSISKARTATILYSLLLQSLAKFSPPCYLAPPNASLAI